MLFGLCLQTKMMDKTMFHIYKYISDDLPTGSVSAKNGIPLYVCEYFCVSEVLNFNCKCISYWINCDITNKDRQRFNGVTTNQAGVSSTV